MATIHAQWQAPGGPPPDSYNLYAGLSPGSETLFQAGITDTQLTFPAVINQPRSAYVTAVYAGVESGPSNRFVITAREPPLPCVNCPASA